MDNHNNDATNRLLRRPPLLRFLRKPPGSVPRAPRSEQDGCGAHNVTDLQQDNTLGR